MTLAIAHRGEPIGHRENTLAAVQAAIDAGADMIEIDVRLTADGVPVLLHDATLHRLWQRPDAVSETGRTDLPDDLPTFADTLDLVAAAGRQLMVDLPVGAAGPRCYDLLADRAEIALFAGDTKALRAHTPDARIALTWNQIELPSPAELAFLRPEYFNPDFRLLTAAVGDAMHALGLKVSVWTVDDPRDMRAVLLQGADAIISNRIATLIDTVRP